MFGCPPPVVIERTRMGDALKQSKKGKAETQTGAPCAPVRRIGAIGCNGPVAVAARDAPPEGQSLSNAARTDRRRATTRRSRLAGCTAS
ncbi:hypothetical protein BDI4_290064 [Burkholderia diffusa]|nr:hypothetical protein BDI4_290064 [Burkholderia diffusa]